MEKITTVLFDLDGTLLPMDQDLFVKSYFGKLAEKMAPAAMTPMVSSKPCGEHSRHGTEQREIYQRRGILELFQRYLR